jgi:hypothetical protein
MYIQNITFVYSIYDLNHKLLFRYTVRTNLNTTISWDDAMQSTRNLPVFWWNVCLNLQGRRVSHMEKTRYRYSDFRTAQTPM